MKLKEIKLINGKIKLLTGLHIGSGDTSLRIGGTDSPVVKNPINNEPYIPGSSIKGKIRSLLELKTGLMGETGGAVLTHKNITNAPEDQKKKIENILKLFGSSAADEENNSYGLTRASFSDSFLNQDLKEDFKLRGISYTEIKSENSINRVKGTANSPRFIERVVPSMEFDLKVSLKIFEGDDNLEELVLEGFKLLEQDALGGSGSRGYGRVKIELDDPELNNKLENFTF